MDFKSTNTTKLTDEDFSNAAQELECEVAAIKAISSVESAGSGFLNDGRPVILFESHAFHSNTHGKYDASNPDISTNSWVHNYGASGSHQYDRLIEAMELDEDAALKSASWGRFQIMGSNYANAGYETVHDFVSDMVHSESYQLDAFICFLQNTGIDKYLKAKDWENVALHYNGSGQVDYYAAKLREAYSNN